MWRVAVVIDVVGKVGLLCRVIGRNIRRVCCRIPAVGSYWRRLSNRANTVLKRSLGPLVIWLMRLNPTNRRVNIFIMVRCVRLLNWRRLTVRLRALLIRCLSTKVATMLLIINLIGLVLMTWCILSRLRNS